MSHAAPVEETTSIDSASFADRQQACRPFVLRGLCADWPAVQAAGKGWPIFAQWLKDRASDATGEAFHGSPEIAGRYYYDDALSGFNFERETLALCALIDRVSARAASGSGDSWYMGSLPADTFLPGFAADHPMPVIDMSVAPRIWVGNASDVACHYDMFDNLACVVAGRRRFTLYPPECIHDLYVGPVDFTMAGQPVAMAAAAPPGDPRYPRFAKAAAKAHSITLHPGDALYLPKTWWHQVEALDPSNMLVNYWWDAHAAGPDSPYAAMMLAMITIADRPPAERAAWDAMFDHYVFRSAGHPLAHLPEEKHGLLGPVKQNYGRIRALVMQMLRNI